MASYPRARRRLRYVSVDRSDFRDGRSSVRVKLRWPGNGTFEGEAEGTRTTEGLLRACARATLQAAEAAVEGRLQVTLAGIKAFRAFDAWVIVCAVRARSNEREYTLTGAESTEEKDSLSAAVRSVLDSINRVLERYAEPSVNL